MKSPLKIFINTSIQFKTRLAAAVSTLLFVISIGSLLFEFFWLRDVARFVEAEESDAILQGGAYQMKQLEKKIERFGWRHAETFAVSFYGDKHWMELLMPYVDRSDYLDCSGDHKDMALSYVTCHAPPQRQAPANVTTDSVAYLKFAEVHAAYWKAWWKENRDKRQWQWVQSGLAECGLKVERPVTGQNTRDILLALGRQKLFGLQNSAKRQKTSNKLDAEVHFGTEIKREEVLPDFAIYNAARWLSDFGGLINIAEWVAPTDLSEQDRLLMKLGIAAYEEQRFRGVHTRLSLDEGQQYSYEELDWERWKENDVVRAERILVPTAICLLVISCCGLAWIHGYKRSGLNGSKLQRIVSR